MSTDDQLRFLVSPGGELRGAPRVPGDKSISIAPSCWAPLPRASPKFGAF